MANIQTGGTTKFYMNQANKIVDVLSEILPTIYFNVFKDDFDVFMYRLWMKPDEDHPPILDKSVLHMGETFQTLENTNWKALPPEKQMEWLKRLDLQALLKALRFRPVSLELFCEKNSLVKEKMEKVLQAMINWRNYGVGHKSVYKYEQMDERVFKLNILEPVWEFYDLLSRYYPKECELLRKTLKGIEVRMKYPDTNVARLAGLTGLPEQTVRDVLALMKVDVGQDGCIKGENEKELVDSIKRLSKKDSVKKNRKLITDGEDGKKSKKKLIIAIAGAALLLLIIIMAVLLTQCGKKPKKVVNSDGKTIEINEETTTVDNRQVVDPFKDIEIIEEESDDTNPYNDNNESTIDYNYLPVDVRIINKDKDKQNIQYDIMEVYNSEAEFLDDKEEYDSDLLLAEENEIETDEYGNEENDEDYSKELRHGQILVIQVKSATVNEHKNIKYADETTGKTYYKYVVKGIEIIKTESHLNTINKKSIKKAQKTGVDLIKAIFGDSDIKVSNIQTMGYYVSLPNNNPENESYLYIIYKLTISGDEYGDMNGTRYCCSVIDNPRYNYKGNRQIYGTNYDGEVDYGGINTDFEGINDHTFFKSVKDVYSKWIIADVNDGNDIYPKPYNNNSKIKKY